MSPCPPIEELLQASEDGHGRALEHAQGCPACAALLEEHRQLEKDLGRLVDPLPPSDLVHNVMAKVAAQPRVQRELWVGLAILMGAAVLGAGSFVGLHGHLAPVFSHALGLVVSWDALLVGLNRTTQAFWRAATLPMAVCLTLCLALALMGLRKLDPVRS